VGPRRPRARTSIGQHYLVNRGVLEHIVKVADIRPGDKVLEIGAGPGNLTQLLLETGASVMALERDRRFEPHLRHVEQRFPENLVTAWGDVLDIDWEPLWGGAPPEKRIIVGNIPYQITSPLIARLADARERLRHAVLMIQREVADRLIAPPATRERSGLTVKVALDFEVRRLFVVHPKSFKPPPKVHSAVIQLTPKSPPPVTDPALRALTRRVIEAAFGSRRQQLTNSLARHWGPGISKEEWRTLLEQVGVEPSLRAERVDLESFVALAGILPAAQKALEPED
jgi:16S rRNA (adenine1518-N6/adenine1519-N6)-dimethyltransferase